MSWVTPEASFRLYLNVSSCAISPLPKVPYKEWSPSFPTTFSMKTAAAVAKPFQPNQARLLTIGSPKPEEQPEEKPEEQPLRSVSEIP